MKNKGFTLVELLAVILLLAVLLAIAVPSLQKVLSNTKNKTYEAFEDTMESAATNYLMNHLEFLPGVSGSLAISAKSLIREGYLETMEDPEVESAICDNESYIIIKQVSAGNGFNLDLDYQPCLICSRYKSSSCPATKPSNMK